MSNDAQVSLTGYVATQPKYRRVGKRRGGGVDAGGLDHPLH